ncbi:type III-B CRISPR module RAMP protein Cmr1 [Actinokineospora sp.]|uniref:type III-B CRISPR module RAMP protein Cmr1 n=1 Tax=Actinokineospora sp. TaxID=1872133 RepID=UPI004037EFC4
MTAWTTFELTVVTPLFSGEDPDQTTDSPIRVPTIRGALRFWFRAIAAGHGVTDLPDLAKAESAVFGSTHTPSPIRLRIAKQPQTSGAKYPPWQDRRLGVRYLLGQGLWTRGEGVRRSFVVPGKRVTLQVRFSGVAQTDARFMIALWALLTYGGIGARVRRGFGQLACDSVTGSLPGDWQEQHLKPPKPKQWAVLGREALPKWILDHADLGWSALPRAPRPLDAEIPVVPTLNPQWWQGVLRPGVTGDLGDALDMIGTQWREFRAPDQPDPKDRNRRRSPEWLLVVNGPETRYPVGALGLPVGYHCPGYTDDVVEPYGSNGVLRRASPVWLRPVAVEDSQWRMFTHVFTSQLLADGIVPRLRSDPARTLTIPNPVSTWKAWLDNTAR